MGGVETWLPTATRAALVRTLARRAGLPPARFLLVVVRLRRLCAACLRRGGLHRGVWWLHLDRSRDWHVGMARARSESRRHLLLRSPGVANSNSSPCPPPARRWPA